MPRFFVDSLLHPDTELDLPPGPARHVQVLRLQPGAAITLFNGQGGEFGGQRAADHGRSEVHVQVGAHDPVDRELAHAITLAIAMPANERMDALVEKATELGVSAIQPLLTERSVLRLSGERAERRLAHWQGVAVAACEQSGRTRIPVLSAVTALPVWLQALPTPGVGARWLLSPGDAPALAQAAAALAGTLDPVLVLSGPEGGLSPGEAALAQGFGFAPVSLGPRVLRADTAPLAVLAWLGLAHP